MRLTLCVLALAGPASAADWLPGYPADTGPILAARYPACAIDLPTSPCQKRGEADGSVSLLWEPGPPPAGMGEAAPSVATVQGWVLPWARGVCAQTIAGRHRAALAAAAGPEQRDGCQWATPIPDADYCDALLSADRALATVRTAADAALAGAVAAHDLAAVTACTWQVEVAP